MVNVLTSSAVDRGFKPRSGETIDYKIGICCFSQGSQITGNLVYTFHGQEKSLNFTEIAKIWENIGNFIAGQGSFVVPNPFGY